MRVLIKDAVAIQPTPSSIRSATAKDATFSEIVGLIVATREKSLQAVNTALIDLYWNVGEIISRKITAAEWGDGVVAELSAYITRTQTGLRGFTRSNLFRMRQFYETYRDDKKVAPLVRQLLEVLLPLACHDPGLMPALHPQS